MIIVGKVVYHRNLKKPNHKGIIIAVQRNNSIFDIAFEDDDVPYRSFSVPQAFVATQSRPALLYTDDIELNSWLDHAKNQYLCTVCGNRSDQLKQYEDMKLCPQCQKEVVSCRQCGKKLIKSNARKDLWYDFFLCDACFNATHCTCSICGKLRKTSNMKKTPLLSSEQLICDYCVDDVFTICDECGNPCPNEQIKIIGGYSYCPDCYSKKTGICDICHETSVDLEDGICYICRAKKSYRDYFCDPAFFSKKSLRIYGNRKAMRELRSTRLMSRLNKSCLDDPFDILILEEYTYSNGRYLDLVIVPEIPSPGYNTLAVSCKMTEFKNDAGYRIRRTIEQTLNNIQSTSIKLDDTHNFILMHKAYVLEAKTYADMNYGDRWYGRDYCEEGNKYGDASTFYVIGAIETTNAKRIRDNYIYSPD